jgi:hypothetical protein
MRSYARLLAWAQGICYALTGLWPLLSMGTFLAVTGPKTDLWLVRTVGVLVLVIGGVLLVAARRRAVTDEVALLGAASALAFACIDVVFVSTRDVGPIYLLDAVLEILLVAGWGLAARRERAKA